MIFLHLSLVLELESRGPKNYTPVHVINITIQDNHDEATFGSFLFHELCEMVIFLANHFVAKKNNDNANFAN